MKLHCGYFPYAIVVNELKQDNKYGNGQHKNTYFRDKALFYWILQEWACYNLFIHVFNSCFPGVFQDGRYFFGCELASCLGGLRCRWCVILLHILSLACCVSSYSPPLVKSDLKDWQVTFLVQILKIFKLLWLTICYLGLFQCHIITPSILMFWTPAGFKTHLLCKGDDSFDFMKLELNLNQLGYFKGEEKPWLFWGQWANLCYHSQLWLYFCDLNCSMYLIP